MTDRVTVSTCMHALDGWTLRSLNKPNTAPNQVTPLSYRSYLRRYRHSRDRSSLAMKQSLHRSVLADGRVLGAPWPVLSVVARSIQNLAQLLYVDAVHDSNQGCIACVLCCLPTFAPRPSPGWMLQMVSIPSMNSTMGNRAA